MTTLKSIERVFQAGDYKKCFEQFLTLTKKSGISSDDLAKANFYLGVIAQYNLNEGFAEEAKRLNEAKKYFKESYKDGEGYLAAGIELAKISESSAAEETYNHIATKDRVARDDEQVQLYAKYKLLKTLLEKEDNISLDAAQSSLTDIESIYGYIASAPESEQHKFTTISHKILYIKAQYLYQTGTDENQLEAIRILGELKNYFPTEARKKAALDLQIKYLYENNKNQTLLRSIESGALKEITDEDLRRLDKDMNFLTKSDPRNPKYLEALACSKFALYEKLGDTQAFYKSQVALRKAEILGGNVADISKLKEREDLVVTESILQSSTKKMESLIESRGVSDRAIEGVQTIAATGARVLGDIMGLFGSDESDSSKVATKAPFSRVDPKQSGWGFESLWGAASKFIGDIAEDDAEQVSRSPSPISDKEGAHPISPASDSDSLSPTVVVGKERIIVQDPRASILERLNDRIHEAVSGPDFKAKIKAIFFTRQGLAANIGGNLSQAILNQQVDLSTLDERTQQGIKQYFAAERSEAGATKRKYTLNEVITFYVKNDIKDITPLAALIDTSVEEAKDIAIEPSNLVVPTYELTAPLAEVVARTPVAVEVAAEEPGLVATDLPVFRKIQAIEDKAAFLFKAFYKEQKSLAQPSSGVTATYTIEGQNTSLVKGLGLSMLTALAGVQAALFSSLAVFGWKGFTASAKAQTSLQEAQKFLEFGSWGDDKDNSKAATKLFREFVRELSIKYYYQFGHLEGEKDFDKVSIAIMENIKYAVQNKALLGQIQGFLQSHVGATASADKAVLLTRLHELFEEGLNGRGEVTSESVNTDINLSTGHGRNWNCNGIFLSTGIYNGKEFFQREGVDTTRYGFAMESGECPKGFFVVGSSGGVAQDSIATCHNSREYQTVTKYLKSNIEVDEAKEASTFTLFGLQLSRAAEGAKALTGGGIFAVSCGAVALASTSIIGLPVALTAAIGGAVAALSLLFTVNEVANVRVLSRDINKAKKVLANAAPKTYNKEVKELIDKSSGQLEHRSARKQLRAAKEIPKPAIAKRRH